MSKLGIFASFTSILGVLTLATFISSANADEDPPAAGPCVRTEFKTEMVKEACAKGGQKAAKEAMKKFNKDNKIKSCNQCHTKLAPKYDLKPDALEQFQKLGGK
jgi:NAD-dependent SIR2 family protein deacetylase